MLLVGIWNGGFSDESVANSNLHVMRFLGLCLEDDVPDHFILSRFRTRLTIARAWDGLLEKINHPNRDDESDAQTAMRVIEVIQPVVDTEARWLKKNDKSVFGYKQHTLFNNNGLVLAVETTGANCHDSKPLPLRQLQRNHLITKVRYVVERTFGSKILRYCGLAKVHAWHILQAMAYNLKRLPKLYSDQSSKNQNL